MGRLSFDRVSVGSLLRYVSFTVNGGEVACVWAPRRTARLAFVHMAAGIEQPVSGTVLVEGRLAFARRSWPPIGGQDVLGQLMLPLLASARSVSRARASALGALCDWGVVEWGGCRLSELEDHELARLALIRALVCDPKVLVVDAPTLGLDTTEAHVTLELFRGARERGVAVLVATASVDAMRDADSLYTISQGTLRGLHATRGELLPFVPRTEAG
jgi:ABC-type iron transport system FetAB ATPase subunit